MARAPPTGAQEPYIRDLTAGFSLGATKDTDVELEVTNVCSLDIFGLNTKLSCESKLRIKIS